MPSMTDVRERTPGSARDGCQQIRAWPFGKLRTGLKTRLSWIGGIDNIGVRRAGFTQLFLRWGTVSKRCGLKRRAQVGFDQDRQKPGDGGR